MQMLLVELISGMPCLALLYPSRRKWFRKFQLMSVEVIRGVSSIFLRVHRSKNAIHKPTHTFGVKMVNKKYAFNYYRYS
jgi:hypothetical protein